MLVIRRLMRKVVKVQNSFLFIGSIAMILFASYLVVAVEKETFPTFFDALWWVMTTVTTVGYGDYFPVSVEGRLIALFLYIFGIGLIGIVIGKVVDSFSSFRIKREEGKIVFKEKDHYIIIGWSQKAKFAVNEIVKTMPSAEILIIDNLDKAPLLEENVHFLKGHASETEVLEKANIKQAKAVLIFADDKITDGQLNDGRTLLIASAIESFAPNVHTVVEVMEEAHIKNFVHVKVNEFIISNETISSLFVRSAFHEGMSKLYGQLLRRSVGEDLFHIPTSPDWKTYKDAFNALLEAGATLVADRDDLSINRSLHKEIPADAKLFAICDESTYQKLIQKIS
ncbi:potassium channel family protein [Radiobacillus kanasensis]|uniref:potassium channel family protein n=1 Tax=Radiobacillus kanasensis TaxID=2844358 RepID=UPI001E4A8F29|nr:potassium channel family protein [Radiobacillus kanasensis]UFT98155.1 potassium channel family protein [Radiobacillus kanasensis]